MSPQTMDHPIGVFFLAHYVLWSVGMLELEVEQGLDALSPTENWKLLTARFCPLSRDELQSRFIRLCETMSDEEALDALLQEVGLKKF